MCVDSYLGERQSVVVNHIELDQETSLDYKKFLTHLGKISRVVMFCGLEHFTWPILAFDCLSNARNGEFALFVLQLGLTETTIVDWIRFVRHTTRDGETVNDIWDKCSTRQPEKVLEYVKLITIEPFWDYAQLHANSSGENLRNGKRDVDLDYERYWKNDSSSVVQVTLEPMQLSNPKKKVNMVTSKQWQVIRHRITYDSFAYYFANSEWALNFLTSNVFNKTDKYNRSEVINMFRTQLRTQEHARTYEADCGILGVAHEIRLYSIDSSSLTHVLAGYAYPTDNGRAPNATGNLWMLNSSRLLKWRNNRGKPKDVPYVDCEGNPSFTHCDNIPKNLNITREIRPPKTDDPTRIYVAHTSTGIILFIGFVVLLWRIAVIAGWKVFTKEDLMKTIEIWKDELKNVKGYKEMSEDEKNVAVIYDVNNAAMLKDISTQIDQLSTNTEGVEENQATELGLALVRGHHVVLVPAPSVDLRKQSANSLKEFTFLLQVRHDNVIKFLGVVLETKHLAFEYCENGTLNGLLRRIKLHWTLKYTIAADIAKGLSYIHRSILQCHGSLSSKVCLVNKNSNIKILISRHPLFKRACFSKEAMEGDVFMVPWIEACREEDMFWIAPEIINGALGFATDRRCDVYSFGAIMHELVYQQDIQTPGGYSVDKLINLYPSKPQPSGISVLSGVEEKVTAEVAADQARQGDSNMSGRVQELTGLKKLMVRCIKTYPDDRPSSQEIRGTLGGLLRHYKLDDFMTALNDRLQMFTNNLSEEINRRTAGVLQLTKKSGDLLTKMLPKAIVMKFELNVPIEPEYFVSVSVYFGKLCNFQNLTKSLSSERIIDLLNSLFEQYDKMLGLYDVTLMMRTTESVMVTSGVPSRVESKKHAWEACLTALHFHYFIQREGPKLEKCGGLRISGGVNSGSCVAGLIGKGIPHYSIFGDTVNVASRMESTGEPMKIQVSKETIELISSTNLFQFKPRGPVFVKGKGNVETYWLTGLINCPKTPRLNHRLDVQCKELDEPALNNP